MALAVALASSELLAGPKVVAKGFFANRAVLVINGETRMLKVGETSPEGVKLLASTSRGAEVEIDGVRQTLSLSRQISATYSEAKVAEVRIPRSDDSHYRVRGAINGQTVDMMVDTGATLIAMSGRDAARLGIDFKSGKRGRSQTAGGIVNSYYVTLNKVSIGGITVHGVPASVVEGNFPVQILLGNSLLSRLEMQEQAGVLVLRQKF
ncbi:MAG: hypothetical protein VR73_14290 [Gammaproteobacteria bacterium BRH_c0]|nr:MAG: hypothetical protein VR73_14290 [Gammaproteobacteria bacterium BRH_c0]